MADKLLRLDLRELNGPPLGGAFGQFEGTVKVAYDRTVTRTDGGQVLGNVPRTLNLAAAPYGGYLDVQVPSADDAALTSASQGYALIITIHLNPRTGSGGYGRAAGLDRELRRQVLSTSPVAITAGATDPQTGNPAQFDIVLLSKLGDAVPVPQEYVDSATILNATQASNAKADQAIAIAGAADAAVNNALNTAGIVRSPEGAGAMVPGAENDTLFFDKDGRYTKLGIDQAGEVSDLTVGSLLGKGLLGSSDDGGGPGARFYGNDGQPTWLGFNAAGLPDATVIGYIVATVGVFGGPTPPEWLPPGAVVTWFKTDASSGELLDVLRLVA